MAITQEVIPNFIGGVSQQPDKLKYPNQAKELLNREPIECNPKVQIDENVKKMDDMNTDNVKITDYPIDEIKKKNKQLKFIYNNKQ